MSINFQGIATALATVSLGLAGVIMAGSMLFPQVAAQYKRQIPDVIIGLILVAIAGFVVSSFSP
jgi:hypothetical protein